MKQYLLPLNRKFYKANLHSHSTNSDGCYSPSELKQLYKSHGYSILSITDHFKFINHSDLSDSDFLFINGCELAAVEDGDYQFKFKKCSHLNLYAKTPEKNGLFEYNLDYSLDSINRLIADANSNGFLVCCNHPTWSMECYRNLMNYTGLFGVEVFNTLSHVQGIDEYNCHEFDRMLRNGKTVYPIAADDCHGNLPDNHPFCDMFGGFVMISATDLSYHSVISALENGDFYASTGPEIFELLIENDIAVIKCSDAKEIKMLTGTRRTARTAVSPKTNEYISEAHFPVSKEDKYFRFVVTDEYGNRALTRAYFC